MIPRSTPYTQRIIVPAKSIEEVCETVKRWFIEKNCSLIMQDPPRYIEANYSANFPWLVLGPRDDHPKTINARLSSFGEDVFLDFIFTQKNDRVGDSGYIFWGVKLGELYEELGVNVTDTVWSGLIREEPVRRVIKNRRRLMIALLVMSVLGLGYFWDKIIDTIMIFYIVFIVPIGILTLWDLQEHKKLLRRKV